MVSVYTERVAQVYGTSVASSIVSSGGGKSGGTSTSNIQSSLNTASTIATTLFTGAAITINIVNTTLLPIANANRSVIGVTGYWGINIRPVENTLGVGINKLILKNTRLANKITKISKVVGKTALIADVGISTWNNFTNDDLSFEQKALYTGVDAGLSVGIYLGAGAVGGIPGILIGVGGYVALEVFDVDGYIKNKLDEWWLN